MGCSCVQSYNAKGNVHFSLQDLAGIWIKAGGNPQFASKAAYIAERESGGNSTATCVNGGPGCSCMGCVDRGLWQIDSVHGSQSTYDVMGNAKAAIAISNNGRDWGAWVTGNESLGPDVTPNMNVVVNGTAAAQNGQTATGQQTNTAELTGIACRWYNPFSYLSCAQDTAGNVVISVAENILNPILGIIAGMIGIAAGGTLVILGIFLIVRQTDTYQNTKQTAVRAVQTGAQVVAPESRLAGATQTTFEGARGVTTQTRTRRPFGGGTTVRSTFQERQRQPSQRVFEGFVRSGPERGQRQRTTQTTTYGYQGSPTVTRSTRETLRDETAAYTNGNGRPQ